MSIALATKGIICIFAAPVYTPMEEPIVSTEEVGSIDIHRTSLDVDIRGKIIEPEIRLKELKPKMKAD
jgi:hypothetical protein